MKKLGKWWQWALLAAFAAALVFGAVQAKQVGDHLQYLVPAPAQQTEDNSGEDGDTKAAPNQPIADQVRRWKTQPVNGIRRRCCAGQSAV